MNRRNFFSQMAKGAALAGAIGCGRTLPIALEANNEPVPSPRDPLKITKVRAILTQPGGSRLVAVRVDTSEPGLYGLGCATFTQRPRTVVTAVEEYLDPFLRGKDPDNIEDLCPRASSFWRR